MHQIKESSRYLANLAALTDIPRLSDALVAIKWALERTPNVFPCVLGSEQVRIIKTESLDRADGSKVRCRIWFKTEPGAVELLVIEVVAES